MTVGCDRVTKHLAMTALSGEPTRSFLADTVRLEYAENTGGFLSLGANLQPTARVAIFKVGTELVLAVGLIAALVLRPTGWQLAGISLALAGGASNLVDRVLHGRVIDFLNVGVGNLRTGIFNIADVAILLGVCILIIVGNGNPNRSAGGRSGNRHYL